jgi:hypothetical protein
VNFRLAIRMEGEAFDEPEKAKEEVIDLLLKTIQDVRAQGVDRICKQSIWDRNGNVCGKVGVTDLHDGRGDGF